MAVNLPPHLAEQYQRILGGRPNERGEILTDWPARTPQEAKASIARAELVKQELRSLRAWTYQERAAALQPYDNLVDLIDRTLLEFDRLTSELETEASRSEVPSPATATVSPATATVSQATALGAAASAPPAATQGPPAAADESRPFAPAASVYDFLTVHAGSVSEVAHVTEWWRSPDSDVESRHLRFLGPSGVWLDGDELPRSLKDAGCSITYVAGTSRHAGIAHPTLNVGGPVTLISEPVDPSGRYVVGVWTPDRVVQVGHLPREVAVTMAEGVHRESLYGALVAAESRRAGSNERVGLKLLLGPGNTRAEPRS
jgi:hypothetical protein